MNNLFVPHRFDEYGLRWKRLFLVMALALALAGGAQAQTWTQTGTGPFSWNTAANWNTGVPNSTSASAIFSTLGGPATQAITLDVPITIGSLDLTNSATSYTFTNGTAGNFTFDNGGAAAATINVGAGSLAQTINASITVGGFQTSGLSIVNNSTNTLTFGGTINNSGNPLAFDGSGATRISGIISGAGALTKNGAGNLTLTGLNTLTGGYTINAGTLTVTSTNTSGTGAINGTVTVNAGATLVATTSNAFGYSSTAVKVNVLNVNGGTVSSTTNNDQGWAITYNLTGATMNTSGGTNAVFAMGGGSAINILPSATPTTFNGQIRLREGNTNDTLVITVADGAAAVDLNMAAIVSTNNATHILTKDGPGFMLMTAQNTYNGPTNIIAGTLQLGDGTTSGGLASATITNNATLILNPGTGTSTVAGVLSGTGTLNKIGPNAVTIGGANGYTGPINVNGGLLRIKPSSATTQTTATINVADGATLAVAPFNTTLTAVTVGTLALGTATGGSLNFELVGQATAPSLAVSTAFTTGGVSPINVSSTGLLTVGQFPLIQYPGTIGGSGFAGLSLGALPPHVAATLVNNTGAGTVDLNVSAADAIRWTGATNGTWDINTTQNWQTATGGAATNYLQPGAVGDFVTFNDLAGGNFTVNVAATVTPASVTVDNTTNAYTFSGSPIAGSFNLVKNGTNTLTVLNDNTYTGGTTINAGTVNVGNGGATGSLGTGPITNAGTLTFNRTGNLTTGAITSTGALSFTVTGNLTTGAINASLPLTIAVGGNLTTGAVTGAAALTFNTGGTITSGAITNNGGLTVNNSAAATIGSVISGTGAVTKQGAGALTLSNAGNSFSGDLTISAGTVVATTGVATGTFDLGSTAATRTITVASGATLSFTVNNVFSGGGASPANLPSLVIAGTMTSTRYNAMPNLTLNGGTLVQAATDSGAYQGYLFIG